MDEMHGSDGVAGGNGGSSRSGRSGGSSRSGSGGRGDRSGRRPGAGGAGGRPRTDPAHGSQGDTQRHVEHRFGFAVEVPRRLRWFEGTIDPLAFLMRWAAEESARERGRQKPPVPRGFFDPDVIWQEDDLPWQSLRILEVDVMRRDTPLADDQFDEMWSEARGMLARALEALDIPGYRLLDVNDTTLGPLPALAFEWCADSLEGCTWDQGGDHALLVWALHPLCAFQVYYHCCGDRWNELWPEARRILDSFELVGDPIEWGWM